jgi:hypothetical protein
LMQLNTFSAPVSMVYVERGRAAKRSISQKIALSGGLKGEGCKEMTWLWRGGEGPKAIPQWAYAYLVVSLKVDPDALSQLKCVEQLDYLEKRPVTLIRIFYPGAAQSLEIRDFASLDQHPEPILYEGYRETQSGKIEILPLNEPSG